MSKIPLHLILKGSILFIIYAVLAINFVFLSPKTVPDFIELETFIIGKEDIYCVESSKKNPAYTKIMGLLKEQELKTYDIGTERCLEIFGFTPQFIRHKNPPENYKIYVEYDKVRIFGKGWLLYQIEANGEVLLSYEETSKNYLQGRKKFFYISLGILICITIPIFRLVYRKIKANV